jgi:hypothetical protein
MNLEFYEKVLTPILEEYININFDFIEKSLIDPSFVQKELVEKVRNMKIIIYSNDHEPPHFHVLSNDHTINAKFSILTCELISGNITSKDQKRVQAFFNSVKTQLIMKKIWEKKYD